MGKASTSLYVRDRIESHPRKGSKRPHKRKKADPAVPAPADDAEAPVLTEADLQEQERERKRKEATLKLYHDARKAYVPEDAEGSSAADSRPMVEASDSAWGAAQGDQADGEDPGAAAAAVPGSSSGIRSGKALYALPTREELTQLSEAEGLFKSNMFRLQMDEMLKAVRCKYTAHKFLDATLREVKAALEGMKNTKERVVSAETDFGGVRPPIGIAADMAEMKFTFRRPTSVRVVGSYLLKTVAKPCRNVDLAVEMPAECFQPKDHLNYRYWHKRAYYLATLARHLRKIPSLSHVVFSTMQGDPLRPILVVRPQDPSGESSTKFEIRIHPCVPEGVFKLHKLAPDRNNIRRAKGSAILPEGAAVDATKPETATPRYNQAVLKEVVQNRHLRYAHSMLSDVECTGGVDAILLLKTWLRQRGHGDQAFGTMNGFVISMLLVHLILKRKLPKSCSSYQMFRGVLGFLASSTLDTEPVVLAHHASCAGMGDAPPPETFQRAFDVNLIDPSGFVNLLSHMPRTTYYDLRHEATKALHLLDNPVSDGFAHLFMKPVSFDDKFDLALRVRISPAIARRYPAQLMDRAGDWQSFGTSLVCTVLNRGLGNRIHLISPQPRQSASWPVTVDCPGLGDSYLLVVGLLLDTENAQRVADIGPAADHAKEAAAFRDFWGSKSELTRFHDGSILEAVSWRLPSPARHRIVKHLCLHVLRRHCAIEPAHVSMPTHLFEPVLCAGGAEMDNGVEATRSLLQSFGRLTSALRDLEMPLRITSLQGVGPAFRYADVFPPQQAPEDAPEGSWLPAQEVLVSLEGSGKWPNDFAAIQQVKAAFYIQLAEMAEEKVDGVKASLTARYLDLLYDGYAFRLVIHTPRELVVLQDQHEKLVAAVTALQTSGNPTKETSDQAAGVLRLVHTVQKAFVLQPLFAGAMHKLAIAFPAFGPTVRLAKRWTHAHMFSPHLQEEAIELLVAHLFASPQAYDPPGSAAVGFHRFVALLATHDFELDPVFVNLDDELTVDDVTEAGRLLREQRGAMPALYIATPIDALESVWTSDTWDGSVTGPSRQLLRRMVAFARSSLAVLADMSQQPTLRALEEGGDDLAVDPKALFRTPTGDYDLLIHLKPEACPRVGQHVDYAVPEEPAGVPRKRKYKNLSAMEGERALPMVDHDPVVLFLAELRARFGHLGLFFANYVGGDVIGMALDPAVKAAHALRPQAAMDSEPLVAEGDGSGPTAAPQGKRGKEEPVDPVQQVRLNVHAVAADCQVIGRGLVDRVEVRV